MSKAYSLFEGSYSVDKSKEFIPFDANIHDPKDRPGSLFIHVHPFLIDSPDGLIICDTGLGLRAESGELLIHQNIRELGFDPNDVRYVLMSHLHQDHAGGMADLQNDTVAFPNAQYVIQKEEWENARKLNDPQLEPVFQLIESEGNVLFVEDSGVITDGIHYSCNGAHTEFHQVFHIYTDDAHYFFGGDVLPEPEEIFVSFIAKYDLDGRLARDLRKEYWAKGAPEGWVYLFYHSKNIAVGKPQEKENGEYILVADE